MNKRAVRHPAARLTLALIPSLALTLGACGTRTPEESAPPPVTGKAEAWNSANNPAFVDATFVYDVAQLPLGGEAKNTPWPGDYWATARDSINARWDGSNPSPAEKVALAFDLPAFPKWITEHVGIYSQYKRCDENSECAALDDGSTCVTPRAECAPGTTCATVPEEQAGRCIPGWYGICHGWAPAAIAEPQPVQAVTKNGVTFYPGDLEALASFAYQARLPTKFISERCNKKGSTLTTDEHGRLRDGECRDMNPGSMYIVLANLLGLRQQGMVEDKTYDYQVWNQPVRRFQITNAQNGGLTEVTLEQALALLGGGLAFSSVLPETTIAKDAQQQGSYQATAAGEIIFRLSGTGDADLYVSKGAAPSTEASDCASTGDGSTEECRIEVAAGDEVHWMVRGYAESSRVALRLGLPAEDGTYLWNDKAQRFFHVKLDLFYLVESGPRRQANNPDSFTRADHYEFILETDQAGQVLGGEWVGASRQAHPDFMWWPTAAPSSDQGGLTYPMIKELLDQAAAPE